MYCIQYDEICKKHNFELKHDALGERVTLEYPADSVPKDTIRLFQNHLPEGVSAMGLSVETGYFDPDDESTVDVPKQLIGFHYVVLKKKV